jgi:hypothetical protein
MRKRSWKSKKSDEDVYMRARPCVCGPKHEVTCNVTFPLRAFPVSLPAVDIDDNRDIMTFASRS